jgi:hypothetical protein
VDAEDPGRRRPATGHQLGERDELHLVDLDLVDLLFAATNIEPEAVAEPLTVLRQRNG